MATPADKAKDTTKGHTWRRFKDGDHTWRRWNEQIFTADETDKCPTYVHKTPPCQASCPSGEDIRGWLTIVRGVEKPPKGTAMQEYAFRRSTEANPFPSMMGRVCPAPCQTGCNRNKVEDYVGINAVEQYIGDYALEQGYTFQAGPDTGKRVAVVGGGPAGLSAAYQLRRKGHAVTLFDDHAELGGMAKYGVPGYRLPRTHLDGEINRIIGMGVEVRANTRVGKDVSLKELETGFDAVLLAIGCKAGRPLPVSGADAPNVISGVAFLEAFNQGRLKAVAGRVVVVGGGDTSVDVVSVARRLGYVEDVAETERPENVVMGHTAHDVSKLAARQGADVMLTSMQPIDKMNAAKHEIEDAQREGVKIEGNLLPKKVVVDEKTGRAVALRVIEVQWDAKGKFAEKPGTERDLEADLVVVAIGQAGDLAGMEELDNGKGLIAADKYYQVPNRPGVFACGDILRPHLLTTVIGQGWRPPPGDVTLPNPLVRNYETADGRWLAINCLQGFHYWPLFANQIGRPELADDPRFATHEALMANAADAVAILTEVIKGATVDEWRACLESFSGQWTVVQDTLEAARDPQSVANGYLQPCVTASGKDFELVAVPMQYDEQPAPAGRAPEFNEHGDAILEELGLDWDTVVELKVKGVVG